MIDVGESNFVPAPATCVRSSVVSGDTVVRRNETLRYNVVPILHYTPRAPIIPPRVVRLRHQLRKHGGTWCRDTYTVSIQLVPRAVGQLTHRGFEQYSALIVQRVGTIPLRQQRRRGIEHRAASSAIMLCLRRGDEIRNEAIGACAAGIGLPAHHVARRHPCVRTQQLIDAKCPPHLVTVVGAEISEFGSRSFRLLIRGREKSLRRIERLWILVDWPEPLPVARARRAIANCLAISITGANREVTRRADGDRSVAIGDEHILRGGKEAARYHVLKFARIMRV